MGRVYLAAALLLAVSTARAGETVRINSVGEAGLSNDVYIRRYVEALCREARLDCEVQTLPLSREVAMMRDGRLDATFGRVRDYADKKDMTGVYRRIDVPFMTMGVYAYTPAAASEIDSWEKLAGRKVSYRAGATYYEFKLARLASPAFTEPVLEESQCAELVATSRIDACIVAEGSRTPRVRELLASGKIRRGPFFDRAVLYPYVNVRRADLVPVLTKAAQALHDREVDKTLRKEILE